MRQVPNAYIKHPDKIAQLFCLFLTISICCGCSLRHPKHVFKLIEKGKNTIYTPKFGLTGPMFIIKIELNSWADPEGWGGGGGAGAPDLHSEKSQKYRVSKQMVRNPLKNHKATKPAFNVGSSSTRQRNAI